MMKHKKAQAAAAHDRPAPVDVHHPLRRPAAAPRRHRRPPQPRNTLSSTRACNPSQRAATSTTSPSPTAPPSSPTTSSSPRPPTSPPTSSSSSIPRSPKNFAASATSPPLPSRSPSAAAKSPATSTASASSCPPPKAAGSTPARGPPPSSAIARPTTTSSCASSSAAPSARTSPSRTKPRSSTSPAHELREIMGITATPVLARAYRWIKSNPQYNVGHSALIDEIDQIVAAHPGLYLAGAAYRGSGIPDCIQSGVDTAAKIESLQAHRAPPAPPPHLFLLQLRRTTNVVLIAIFVRFQLPPPRSMDIRPRTRSTPPATATRISPCWSIGR